MSSPAGSKLWKTSHTTHQNDLCVCGRKECTELTKCFQSINDVRGRFFALPQLDGKRMAEFKRFKLNAWLRHFGITESEKENYSTADIRKRVDNVSSNLRSRKTKVQRHVKRVAYHHFHPEILQYFVIDQGMTTIDTIPTEFIHNAGLYHNGYTDIDIYEGKLKAKDKNCVKVFVPVPSYKHAAADFQYASARYQLQEIIQSVRSGRPQGRSILSEQDRNADGGIPSPVPKRARQQHSFDKSDFQRALRMVSDDNDELHAVILALKAENAELKRENEMLRSMHAETYVQGRHGGLCRLSITSDKFHQNNPNVAKNLFGFEDVRKSNPLSGWDITKQFILDMFGLHHEEPTLNLIQDALGRPKRLSKFEQCLLTLTWFEKCFDHEFLATVFGCTVRRVSLVIRAWAPAFREVGYHLARLPLTKEFLDETYPEEYRKLNFNKPVATVVDGTDVLLQTVRVDRAVNVCQTSSKSHHSAARGITWSTPMGLVHEFTDPFFGRASEKALVALWGKHGRLADLPIGYLVSGDKGFDQTSGCYPRYNPVIHPAFLTGGNGAQFSVQQAGWNRRACKMRYTSEVVFSRVKQRGGLGGIVNRNKFPYLRELWAWAHGRANYYQALQKPPNCTFYPKSKYSRKKN